MYAHIYIDSTCSEGFGNYRDRGYLYCRALTWPARYKFHKNYYFCCPAKYAGLKLLSESCLRFIGFFSEKQIGRSDSLGVEADIAG